MRIVVDPDLCEANGVCMSLVPEVFDLGEDDQLHIIQEEPPEEHRPRIVEAVRLCPRLALSIED